MHPCVQLFRFIDINWQLETVGRAAVRVAAYKHRLRAVVTVLPQCNHLQIAGYF